MSNDISMAEWRAALDVADRAQDDPGETAREVADLLGIAPRTAREKLLDAVRRGVVESGVARRTDSRGRTRWVPVYDKKGARDKRTKA